LDKSSQIEIFSSREVVLVAILILNLVANATVGTTIVGMSQDPYLLRGQPSCCRSTGQSSNKATWCFEVAKPKQSEI